MEILKRKNTKLYQVSIENRYMYLHYHNDSFVHEILIPNQLRDEVEKAYENEDWEYFENFEKKPFKYWMED